MICLLSVVQHYEENIFFVSASGRCSSNSLWRLCFDRHTEDTGIYNQILQVNLE